MKGDKPFVLQDGLWHKLHACKFENVRLGLLKVWAQSINASRTIALSGRTRFVPDVSGGV